MMFFQIAKVASSTFCRHFIDLGKLPVSACCIAKIIFFFYSYTTPEVKEVAPSNPQHVSKVDVPLVWVVGKVDIRGKKTLSRREAGEAAEVRGKYLLGVLLNGLDQCPMIMAYICLGLGHAGEEWFTHRLSPFLCSCDQDHNHDHESWFWSWSWSWLWPGSWSWSRHIFANHPSRGLLGFVVGSNCVKWWDRGQKDCSCIYWLWKQLSPPFTTVARPRTLPQCKNVK